MTKVKHSPTTRARKKKVMKRAKGFWGDRSKQFQQARRAVAHAMVYAYEARKQKKRDFRRLWITRISIACRESGTTYSVFIKGLKKANIALDRKVMADLLVKDPAAFQKLLEISKQ